MNELYYLLERRKDPNDDVEWQDLCDFLTKETGEEVKRDFLRKSYPLFDWYNRAGCITPPEVCGEKKQGGDQESDCVREIQKERVKFQTEKIEYNRWLRENARDELIIEKLSEAIRSLSELEKPQKICDSIQNRSAILCFGDVHMGAKFEIRGLDGEILNAYNTDIAKDRMWGLLDRTISLCRREGLTRLYVYDLGDAVDGVLRQGQLIRLERGVVESTILYSELMAKWLAELSRYVVVHFQMTGGNHDTLRLLQQKPIFKDEDMSKIVRFYLKARLEGNQNFIMTVNPTGYIYDEIAGVHVLGLHGSCKSLEKTLKDFSAMYGARVDLVVGAHYHHMETENIGYGLNTVRIPSVIGLDPYALSLNKSSNAGAMVLVLEDCVGLVTQHFIHLN